MMAQVLELDLVLLDMSENIDLYATYEKQTWRDADMNSRSNLPLDIDPVQDILKVDGF